MRGHLVASHAKMDVIDRGAAARVGLVISDQLAARPGSRSVVATGALRAKPPLWLTDGQFSVAWYVDVHYDGCTFCIRQASLRDPKKWDKMARTPRRIAINMIDPRGNEGLRIQTLPV